MSIVLGADTHELDTQRLPSALPVCDAVCRAHSVEDYHSGMTFSRAACARASHPHFDTSVRSRPAPVPYFCIPRSLAVLF